MPLLIRVLIVEDSEDDTALLVRELRRGGYEVTFERVATPGAMNTAIAGKEWDIVICDYSMPHFSGLDALNLLRARSSEVPFIFVSGTIGEETAVAALRQGAQDYLMKNNLKRLLPAIRREVTAAQRRREQKLHVQQLEKFEAIGRLAGGIAHDFNNALTVIIGWSELGYEEAHRSNLPVPQERFRAIRDEAQRSAGLTAQLLAFARKIVLQPRDFDLNELVTETTGLLRSAIGDRIELRTTLAPILRSIRADATQIRQVIVNLGLNARDAMPQGGCLAIETKDVEVGEDLCKAHGYGQPGSYVLLAVSDTGIGMDSATLDRIFEPFFTTKEKGRGTGLGLSTVYGIVKQHDGFVNVRSEPGQGTTFRVYIPASLGAPEAFHVPAVVSGQGGSETILVAEDHAALRELACKTLEARGYEVILATNGAEAVRAFEASWDKIQLVVLDVSMPLLNGLEAYSQMCLMNPSLPAIFTTGHTSESASLGHHIEKGAVFLQKPYDPQSLGRAVRSRLDREDR